MTSTSFFISSCCICNLKYTQDYKLALSKLCELRVQVLQHWLTVEQVRFEALTVFAEFTCRGLFATLFPRTLLSSVFAHDAVLGEDELASKLRKEETNIR